MPFQTASSERPVPVEKAKKRRHERASSSVASSSTTSLRAPVPPKKVKLISETCKVCFSSMRDRKFLPDRSTFYCSTDCIRKKAEGIAKMIAHGDEIQLTDKRGRIYPGKIPSLKNLEGFLLSDPSYEPVVKSE